MAKHKKQFIVAISLLILAAIFVFVWQNRGVGQIEAQTTTTYYMCLSGCDFSNLRDAFNGMRGGDTLIIKDGVYTGNDNRIHQWNRPPSGSAGNYTILKAENDGEVSFENTLTEPAFRINGTGSGPMSYIQFEGIKWIGGTLIYGTDHIKFLRCAFEGKVREGNSVTFGTHSCTYTLLEDCIAYGQGRYNYMIYNSSEAVLRRCVARQDYANRNLPSEDSEPIAIFCIYSSANVELQNCISIDSDQPQWWQDRPTEFGGSVYGVGSIPGNKVISCIFLNNTTSGSSSSYPIRWENNVLCRYAKVGIAFHSDDVIDHSTFVGMVQGSVMGLTANQEREIYGYAGTIVDKNTENSILMDAYIEAIRGTHSLGYNVFWNNNGNGYTVGTDIVDVNPIYDQNTNPSGALKYLVRVEDGSALDGAAGDGGDIGANVLKRIGQSGTHYGEPGYDEVTDKDLWPWPNEDWVKEEMGNYNRGGADPNLPRGDRGFAVYVSPFGSPNTLTSYIWEYLGNQIPCEVYNTCGQPEPEPIPNITLTKRADKTQAQAGEEIVYTIAYTNQGQGAAQSVVITDNIPEGTTYVAGSATAGGVFNPQTSPAGSLTWNIASLPSGQSGNAGFKVKVE